MRRFIIFIIIFGFAGFGLSENYLINGGQESRIRYELVQRVEPTSGTKYLKMSFVIPESFHSPTYNQRIEGFVLDLKPRPSSREDQQDQRGNRIVVVEWDKPGGPVDVSMRFNAHNKTILQTLRSQAKFPLGNLTEEFQDYLAPTGQVQSDNPQIAAKARSLVQGVKTEFDAVQKILSWVVDNMRYVTPPQEYDALYSFENGKGNCQNYSHLSAALMRAAGIPVRIVNGVTLKQPFSVRLGRTEFTFKMGQGRHSWIEVYFTDLGWVPFDPQQTEMFVSNRFIRIEVGVDNAEAVNDGMVRWRQAKNVQGTPRFQETIEADFVGDQVNLTIAKQDYGPQKMLLCPQMDATFTQVVVKPSPPPIEIPRDKLDQMVYKKPFLFGNLDFPTGVDFAFARGPAEKGGEDEYAMKKNFMVETAEYVTTKMTQYAQIFVLEKPLKMIKSGLALHKFGGSGQIWLEVMADNGGRPGQVLGASDFISLNNLSSKPGYDWVDFDFSKNPLILSPGKYWIALGFTGSPIVNWFYTYGKPVGPVDGTRYKGVYDQEWSGALAYEFNYRVVGWTTK